MVMLTGALVPVPSELVALQEYSPACLRWTWFNTRLTPFTMTPTSLLRSTLLPCRVGEASVAAGFGGRQGESGKEREAGECRDVGKEKGGRR